MIVDMPGSRDFRTAQAFNLQQVDASGKDVGRRVYWKLYAIENMVRVLIHSVLCAQINPSWWASAVDQTLQNKAQGFRRKYTSRPWHTSPGIHDIYYIDLLDLNEIIRANSHLFLPVVPDIDQWVAKIEQIRLPRNVVAHMNWPSDTDRKRIDVLYEDVLALVKTLSGTLSFLIP
jgi:hypothetical protein